MSVTAQQVQHVLKYWADSLIKGKRCLVIASQEPWQESLLIHYGARHVSTVELGEIDSRHPYNRIYTPADFAESHRRGTIQPFDLVLITAWVQHTGLGRFGEALEPNGDLFLMRRAMSVMKPGAFGIISIPTGVKDKLIWNRSRVYGPHRLRYLFGGWDILASHPNIESEGELDQPSAVWILKNNLACNNT